MGQIDNVKAENTKLKAQIVQMEKQQAEIKQTQQQQQKQQHSANLNVRNPMMNARGGGVGGGQQFSKQSSMDIDQNDMNAGSNSMAMRGNMQQQNNRPNPVSQQQQQQQQ